MGLVTGGTGALYIAESNSSKEHYIEILMQHLKISNRELKFGHILVYKIHNDPNHKAKLVTVLGGHHTESHYRAKKNV